MLAHRVCASIPHRLVTFHEPRNIFNICPHQLVTFENVTYWCVMLAHKYYSVNVGGSINLIEIMEEFGVKKIFREIDLFDFTSFFGLDFF